MSAVDCALRQCLLKLLHARIGNLRLVEIQLLELDQPREILQSGIGDLGAVEQRT